MNGIKFKVNVSINDETGELRASYLRIRDGFAAETKEVVPGKAFADYSEEGELLGIEFLAPCDVKMLDPITEKEPAKVKRFFRSAVPHELVCG